MAPVTFSNAGKASSGVKSTQELKSEVQERIDKLHKVQEEQSAYLGLDDIAELEKMEVLLQGALSILDQYEKTGGALPSSTSSLPAASDDMRMAVKNMPIGWSGSFQMESDTNGVYNHILKVVNQGPGSKGALVFKMDETMKSVDGSNVGKDILVTVTYKDNHTETFLLKNQVTSASKIVFASTSADGVTMNFAQVKRVNAEAPGFTLLGGAGKDILIGSQGADVIDAGEGVDTVYGMGGDDAIQGGVGQDILVGGAGADAIDGGADYDFTSVDSADVVVDPEDQSMEKTQPLDKKYLSGTKGWEIDNKNGETVLSKSESADNAIALKVPDGYMAFGKQDGDDLVMTLQHIDEGGMPMETSVVRIKGVLAKNKLGKSNQSTISIESGSVLHNGIIDLGGVNVGFNSVSLKKGKANDVLIAPSNELDHLKIKIEHLGNSSIGKDEATGINKKMTSKDKSGDQMSWITSDTKEGKPLTTAESTVGADGSISLTLKGEVTDTMDLNLPTEFMNPIMQQGKGELVVTAFKYNADGKVVDRLVIRIKQNSSGNPSSVTANSLGVPTAAMAVKLMGQGKGGVFVGSDYSTDKSDAGDNDVILNKNQ